MGTKVKPWPLCSWSKAKHNMKVGIIDFKRTPNWTFINESSVEGPYFLEFIYTLHRQSRPGMTKLLVWLWICRTKEAKVQVLYYVHNAMYRDIYD